MTSRHPGLALAFAFFALTATACGGPLRLCVANCTAPVPARFQPDNSPPLIVTLLPSNAWLDTGLAVNAGERFLIRATGGVFWAARNSATDADGTGGDPGWRVGAGGLVARVGAEGKPFDVGARTSLFSDRHPRPPHHPYPPPPLTMPRAGRLYLGFKAFTTGANTGSFAVTIQRAVPVM